MTDFWFSPYLMVLALSVVLPACSAAAGSGAAQETDPEAVRFSASPNQSIRFRVVGRLQTDETKAYQSALASARDRIVLGLRELKPHLTFDRLTRDMVDRFVVSRKTHSEYIKPPVDKVMYATTLDLEISKQDQQELYKLMRLEESQLRQAWLVRPYILIVVVLLVAAAYFRLEEKTKGYYTYWLRTAAVLLLLLTLAGVAYFSVVNPSVIP
ncbi:MAG: hypothetical protein NZM31_10445 [Gemmatales bacterium]|nr:hypothetical protein [Gemmatales bacterium]MDW8387415.1 hypothetical protein [Gemmatales bacterium]